MCWACEVGRLPRRGLPVAVTLAVMLSGCSDTAPDPALTSAASDARSAAQSTLLNLRQEQRGLRWPAMTSVVAQDMGEELTDAARRLELHRTRTPTDSAYRREALKATRTAIDGVHAAQQGDGAGGRSRLQQAIDSFEQLEAE